MAVRGAAVLLPVFERENASKGWQSVQTNPANYRDPARMVEQGARFAGLAPNIQVKFPVTSAGMVAIEEATSRGININATVSFTVDQAIASAEAVERGLGRLATFGRRPHEAGPGLGDHDRPARRLAEGRRRARRSRGRPGRTELGRHRRLQARLRDLP